MRWLSLAKYLLGAAMDWYAEWKPQMDREREERRAEDAAKDVVGAAFRPKDANYTEHP